MSFKIQIENFEGPIDVLLQLIEKRKMPINDISLAHITDDYIRFIQDLENESLSHITHFIFVASTLTLIKSKSLLPNLELTDEEEGDIDDLKRRIELFKSFQDISIIIKDNFWPSRRNHYPRPRKRDILFQAHDGIHTTAILESLQSIFAEMPKKETTKKEASIRISIHIDEMMDSLRKRIEKHIKTDFSSFISKEIGTHTEPKIVRVYKVIGFLAMLEMVKNRALNVFQKENFDSISIESTQ